MMRSIIYRVTILFFVLLCLNCRAQAQSAPDANALIWKAGLGLGLLLNNHETTLNALPGVPSCAPNFSNGNGSGIAVSGFGGFVVASPLLVALRLSYSQLDGRLQLTQSQLVDDNGAKYATIEYSLATKISTIALGPELRYSLAPLELRAGLSASVVTASHFDQIERITAPSTVVFNNDRRDRMNFSGDINKISSMLIAVELGVSTSFALDAEQKWSCEPYLSYSRMLSNALQTPDPWRIHSLQLGASIVFSRRTEVPVKKVVEPPLIIPPEPIPVRVAEVPPPKKKLIAGKLQPNLLDTNKQQMDLQFVVRKTISQNTYAMINYVFFDSASTKIPARYKLLTAQESERFRTSELNATSTMQIYYSILNLVGYRMRQDMKKKILLIGCNSGDGAEKNNVVLSKARAEAVKEYLTTTWAIDASRIATTARNLPESPSSNTTLDGIEENRRVEIHTESSELLDPLIFNDTTSTLNAASVKYPGSISPDIFASTWQLTISSSGTIVTTLGDQGAPPKEITWETQNDLESIQHLKGSLSATLRVVDTDGVEYKAESDAMEVKQQIVRHSSILRFSLITFAFNTSNISKSDRRIVSLIKKNIATNSTVYVTGYTDRVGEAEHNQQLSVQRAQQVAKVLNVTLENAKGEGAGNPLYDNRTPEGRFYSRTVIVTIETPLD